MSDMGAKLHAGLKDAMERGMREFGYTSEQATRDALAHMIRSARARTKLGAAKRPVFDNPHFAHLMRKPQYKLARTAGRDMRRYYKFGAYALRQNKEPAFRYANQKDRIEKIARRGLAKASWGWGLARLRRGGGVDAAKEIAGVVDTYTLRGRGSNRMVVGRGMENRLAYITRIMPAGWEQQVADAASRAMLQHVMRKQAASMGYEMQKARAA